jgi:hypothetical protein
MSWKTAFKSLLGLFQWISEAWFDLFLYGQKCQFMKDKIHFLGHVKSSQGLHPDPQKVSAV